MPELAAFPQRITLELTSRCNYRCAMCPSRLDPQRPQGHMAPALFRRLVEEAAGHLPVALVPFFRGESLLHPEIVPLLAFAKQRVWAPPAGQQRRPPDRRTWRAGWLLDLGLDFISFSLDSADPGEYARMRPGGDLGRITANVRRFLDLRDRGNYPTQVQVSATRTELNAAGVAAFVASWRELADRVRVYQEHSKDGHPGSLDPALFPEEMPRRPCRKPFEEMVVYFDGQAALCNHDWFRSPSLGDAAAAGILGVCRSPAYLAIRDAHRHPADLEDATCRHCGHWRVPYLPAGHLGELYVRSGEAAHGNRA